MRFATRGFRRALATVACASLLPVAGWAQGKDAATTTPADPAAAQQEQVEEEEVLSAPEVAGKSLEVEAELQNLRDIAKETAPIQKILEALPEYEKKLRVDARETNQRIEASESLAKLREQKRRWEAEKRDLEARHAVVTARALEVGEAIGAHGTIKKEWSDRLEDAADKDVPEVVRTRIREVLNVAATTEQKLTSNQAGLLELQDRITGSLKLITTVIDEVQQAIDRSRSAVLGATAPPIWSIAQELALDEERIADRIAHSLEEERAVIYDYVVRRRDKLIVAGVFFVGFFTLLLFLRPRAQQQRLDGMHEDEATQLLRRPLSASFVLTLLIFSIFNPGMPQAVNSMAGVAILIPLAFFVWPIMTSRTRPVLIAVLVFVAIDRAREVIQDLPSIEQVLFTAELGVALLLFVWMMHSGRFKAIAGLSRWQRLIEVVQPVMLLLIALGFAATAMGWVRLGTILGESTMRSGYNAFAIWLIVQTATAVLLVTMASEWAQRLRVVRLHGILLTRRLRIGIQLLGFGYWLDRSLGFLGVRDPVYGAIETALSTPLEAGALAISLGGVLSFFVAIMLAVYSARFIKFVLDEEVMPRVHLPRGVPYAISASARYIVLALGFAAAVSAAGIDLSKVTLLAGALGVGIGFGLQNVVGNFVSGLILLFERPIQTGDTISVGTLMGEVRHIGIRASTVRDFDGAEVIVPNANLLSEMVTNWTYSDRQRRMEILIGVAYGTDPQQVIELLQRVVGEDEELLQEPGAIIHFMDFGDSSLDFRVRAWTDNFDDFWSIRSRLAIEINRAIKDAGITVAYPQRDLHLRSVDVAATQSEAQAPEGSS